MRQLISNAIEPHGLIRHRRYSEADFLRAQYPYQVEIIDYLTRMVARTRNYLDTLHREYESPASWCDHEGARTFGFNTEAAARRFVDEQGGAWVKGGPE